MCIRDRIKLEKYRENLPVAIAIADRNKTSGEKSDDSVQDAVQKVAKALLIDAVFQAESEIYYIYTTHRLSLIHI